ncbi:zinc-binding domain-containing protein [Paraphoma chrysanthemicola]|uniref:Zinc-binding domain-containing protein n=1 Tax=Paraphoma chrysanthemicola TaxID=798071 RepID=A0A8K0R0H8_9PLEO|nr:zinc-binding domain-containing protein [Paraphoma chrysanthemicola]
MSAHCQPCQRNFSSDEALQQHKRESSAHKFDCTTCNRHFKNDQALTQHLQNAAVHLQNAAIQLQSFEHPTILATPQKQKPTTKRKSTAKPKQTKKWSMYPSLHNDVSDLLSNDDLFFTFYENDDNNSCTEDYDTTIMGQFNCSNPSCRGVWTSKQIAITIREYSNERYNARVYYQSCKRCRMTSEPVLDHSYAERVAYRLKKWSGVQVERPPFSGQSKGPHRSDLCEGCKQGHCSNMVLGFL